MKTPSGTFALKLVILAASVTASIVLISACWKASFLTGGDPILIIFDADGVKTRAPSADVEKAFDDLIKKHGEGVCNVDYYKDNKKLWHKGNRGLTTRHAIRSTAAGNPAPADPSNLVMKVAFADLDEEQEFLSTINPTPTPTPTPTTPPQ
ncbi:MAG TPA: hypothetical protein VFU09_13815 [Candidatus Udaeobacter sp.]|nr:hypothetical protein [Candidatus Udaeobacter sp.]